MFKRTAAAILFCLFLTAGVQLHGSDAPAYQLHLTETTITAHVEHMPVQALLRRMADFGIAVSVDPAIRRTVTAHLTQVPLEEGMRRLFSPLSYSLVWSAVETSAGKITRLSEVHVFRPGRSGSAERLTREEVFEVVTDPETGALLVRGELLVRIGRLDDFERLKALLARYGGVIVGDHAATGILRIRLPDHAAFRSFKEELRAIPSAVAEPHYAYRVPAISALGTPLRASRVSGAARGDVVVAVLDSGMSASALAGSATIAPYNAVTPGADTTDTLGHGTHMALIASGRVAPRGAAAASDPVPVIPVKIFDGNGITSNFTVLRAVSHAIDQGARILSLSWGSETESAFLGNLLAKAQASGLTLVGASGNAPTGEPVYPAAYPSVVGVGALSPDGTVWASSNRGDFVTLYASGYADFDGDLAEKAGAYAGTSVAAAYTANRLAAFFREHPDADVADFLRSVKDP